MLTHQLRSLLLAGLFAGLSVTHAAEVKHPRRNENAIVTHIWAGCPTEQDAERLLELAKQKDVVAFNRYKLEHYCENVFEGETFIVDDLSFWTGYAQIRRRGDPHSLWVPLDLLKTAPTTTAESGGGAPSTQQPPAGDDDHRSLEEIHPCPTMCDEQLIGSWKLQSGFSLWLKGEPPPDRGWWLSETSGVNDLNIICIHGEYSLSLLVGEPSSAGAESVPLQIVLDEHQQFMGKAKVNGDTDLVTFLEMPAEPRLIGALQGTSRTIVFRFPGHPEVGFFVSDTGKAVSTLKDICR